jgi:hypothetical protein
MEIMPICISKTPHAMLDFARKMKFWIFLGRFSDWPLHVEQATIHLLLVADIARVASKQATRYPTWWCEGVSRF